MATLRRVLAKELPRIGKEIELDESESNHLIQVLRLQNGDRVEALDGQGHAQTVVLRIRSKSVFLAYIEGENRKAIDQNQETLPVHLEVAILKGDAFEWVIEKAVEMGIRRLTPIETAHTVVQVSKKGPEAFQARWQKIADQALKQCGRLTALEIDLPVSLDRHLSLGGSQSRFIAMETKRAEAKPLMVALESFKLQNENLRILVGPEGGFSQAELTLLNGHGLPISLGPLVLRAETAALVAGAVASSWLRSST